MMNITKNGHIKEGDVREAQEIIGAVMIAAKLTGISFDIDGIHVAFDYDGEDIEFESLADLYTERLHQTKS